MISLDAFFDNYPDSLRIFERLLICMDLIGPAELRVSKSQIVLRRRKDFAWIWIPGRYLRGRHAGPLVLSLNYPSRDPSTRWKEIVEAYPGRFMHHLEIFSESEINDEVCAWLKRSWETAA